MVNRTDTGLFRILTPEQISAYQSQWKRYRKASEITSDAFTILGRPTDGASGGEDIRVQYLKPSSDPIFEETEPSYYVTVRQIGRDVVTLYEQEFEEKTGDGALVESLGTYQTTSVLEGLSQSYIVLDKDDGRSVALVAATNNAIFPVGEPRLVSERIRENGLVGYACTCADYTNASTDINPSYIGDLTKTWGGVGSYGLCKHILAFRLTRGEIVSTPADIPMVNEDEPTSTKGMRTIGQVRGNRSGKKGKGMS